MCVEVKESYINPLSAVSGCGLAFMYLAIEAMSDGGVKVGLPRALAMDLVTQTLIGAARLVQESGKHPGQVKTNFTRYNLSARLFGYDQSGWETVCFIVKTL